MDKKRVLVTGSNGFLGRTILYQLLTSGISVCATDLGLYSGMSDFGSASATAGFAYQKADITRQEELKPVFENVTTVIHVAGLAHIFSPDVNSVEKFRLINEIGTANVASAAAETGIEHLILISSVAIYGPYTNGMYDENTPCNPVGPYALSKYRAELRAIEIATRSGMALTILRLATLYGEGDPGNVGRLMRLLDRGRFFWIGDGSNRKSLLYKGDAARACLAVAGRPAAGVRVYNVSAPPCTMRDIVDGLAKALGKKPLPGRIPARIAISAAKVLSCFPNKRLLGLQTTIQKWLSEDVYDTRRIECDYEFHTQVELSEGLKREMCWYRQNEGRTCRW